MDVETIGGTSCACCSVGAVSIPTDEGNSAKIDVLVVRSKPLGFDLLLGIDVIKALGGIVVGPTGSVQLGARRTTRYYSPNPSARAGYDTRSIFKRSLTGLNSEFSFS